MEFVKEIFQKDITKRIFVFIFLIMVFYTVRSLFNLILLTFLFTYLINSLESFIFKKLNRFMKVNKNIITILIYAALFTTIIVMLSKYIPRIVYQGRSLIKEFEDLNIRVNDFGQFGKYLVIMAKKIDIASYSEAGMSILVDFAANVGKWSIYIFIALMLSMFFMLEKNKMINFMSKFENSRIAGFYNYASFFGNNFLNSFGKVIQAQILIAVTNSILSIVALWVMRFPQLLALWAMIFILSLIPVAGVIVSLIPLGLIAFKLGGVMKVLSVFIMILVLHGLESYVLNPKFMSDKTELPVFLTFVILIVSEHFMGVWGMLIGIPLFIFILDLIGIDVGEKNKQH